MVFNIYSIVQNAYLNIDYDTLEKYTSDSLSNVYKNHFSALDIIYGQNTKNEISYIDCKICNISNSSYINSFNKVINTKTLVVFLKVSKFKYCTNSGTKSIELTNEKEEVSNLITFVKNEYINNNFVIDKIEIIE